MCVSVALKSMCVGYCVYLDEPDYEVCQGERLKHSNSAEVVSLLTSLLIQSLKYLTM